MFASLIRRTSRPHPVPQGDDLQSTIFTLSTQVPRPRDGRTDPRLMTMLPVAKLIGGDRQDLCRIRNISAGGISAEVTTAQAVGTIVEIELGAHQRIPGEIVWVRGSSVGIRFDSRVDLRQLLADRRPVEGRTPRPPRLEISCGATVRIGDRYHRVDVQDISLGGMKVALGDWQSVGKTVQVSIESFRTVKGRVAWFKGGQAGIVFDRDLKFEELAAWLGKRVEIASLRSGAWDQH